MDDETGHSLRKVLARSGVFLYALLFTAFCVWGITDDVQTGEPVAEVAFWVVFDALVCYGMFALALPPIRTQFVARSWRYIAVAIPIVVYSTAAWEIATETDELAAVEYVIIGALFLVVTTPAIAFNFVLGQRLSANSRPHANRFT